MGEKINIKYTKIKITNNNGSQVNIQKKNAKREDRQ